mgnify:CR=1 FL=1
MKLIAGSLLTQLLPVWHYIRTDGVMVNSFEILSKRRIYSSVFRKGLRKLLSVDVNVALWVDSGGYQFLTHGVNPSVENLAKLYGALAKYETQNTIFVSLDYPPLPSDSENLRKVKIENSIKNYKYLVRKVFNNDEGKLVPVIHLATSKNLLFKQIESYSDAEIVGVGGLVPYILSRGPRDSRLVALAFIHLVKRMVKEHIGHDRVHVFGFGAPSVIPFLRLLRVYSTDSMTWRVKAAYGKIILPGCGERHVTDRVVNFGRMKLSLKEREKLFKLLDEFNRVSREKISFDDLRRDFTKRAIFNFWVLNMYAHSHDGFMVPRVFRKLMVRVREIMGLSDDEILEFIASRFKH